MVEFNKDEYSDILCRKCGEMKRRYQAGTFPNGKDKRWVDSSGFQFNGKLCPQCNLSRVNLDNRIKRESRKFNEKLKEV